MIHCRKCGAQMPDTATFCKECGASLSQKEKAPSTQFNSSSHKESLIDTLNECHSQFFQLSMKVNKELLNITSEVASDAQSIMAHALSDLTSFDDNVDTYPKFNQHLKKAQQSRQQTIHLVEKYRSAFEESYIYLKQHSGKTVSLAPLSLQSLEFPPLDSSTDRDFYVSDCYEVLFDYVAAVMDLATDMLEAFDNCKK